MNKLFSFETLRIHFSPGRAATAVLLFVFLFLGLLEICLRIIPVPPAFFVPGIDRELNYPEIDIKISLLSDLRGVSVFFAWLARECAQRLEACERLLEVCFGDERER